MDVQRATSILRALSAALAVAASLVFASSAAAQGEVGDDPPPIGEQKALEIAKDDPAAVEAQENPDVFPSANRSDNDGDWEVGFYDGSDQILQVVVDDRTGKVEETWTGHQVAWRMARGYEGAFGRAVNSPWIWLPLCIAFIALLFDYRRPFRVAHLDLLVIVAGFGISHLFFNQGRIGLSVPLAYPALVYLLARTLWLGFRGGDGLRPSLPTVWIAIVAIGLLGFRVGLNTVNSNVIDVGYAGVIGADKISDGDPLYGGFPEDNSHGDTYGPVNYYAYQPFEQAMPWSGSWDDLPAAHAASVFFDLATAALLLWLGTRLRPGRGGLRLGVLLAAGWAACPYTAFALESNSNDALVSLLLVAALAFLASPPARGAFLALAALTKFAPAALGPLFLTYDPEGRGRPRTWGLFALGFAAATLAAMARTILDPGLTTFWDRTVGNQAGRDSPFSVWGQADLEWLHTAVKLFAVGLAVLVAFRPRTRNPVTVAALGAAVILAVQLTVEHWFYLYIPWFLPFLLVALLARNELSPGPGTEPAR